MNDRALRAVKKLYICLCAARDTGAASSPQPIAFHCPAQQEPALGFLSHIISRANRLGFL
jgi:hypothetical protein